MRTQDFIEEIKALNIKIYQEKIDIGGLELVTTPHLYIDGEKYTFSGNIVSEYIVRLYHVNKGIYIQVKNILKQLSANSVKMSIDDVHVNLIYNRPGAKGKAASRIIIEKSKEKKNEYVKFSLRFTDPEACEKIRQAIRNYHLTEEVKSLIPQDIKIFLKW